MEGVNSRSGRRFGGMKKALMEAVDVGVGTAENVWFYEEQRGGGGERRSRGRRSRGVPEWLC